MKLMQNGNSSQFSSSSEIFVSLLRSLEAEPAQMLLGADHSKDFKSAKSNEKLTNTPQRDERCFLGDPCASKSCSQTQSSSLGNIYSRRVYHGGCVFQGVADHVQYNKISPAGGRSGWGLQQHSQPFSL